MTESKICPTCGHVRETGEEWWNRVEEPPEVYLDDGMMQRAISALVPLVKSGIIKGNPEELGDIAYRVVLAAIGMRYPAIKTVHDKARTIGSRMRNPEPPEDEDKPVSFEEELTNTLKRAGKAIDHFLTDVLDQRSDRRR